LELEGGYGGIDFDDCVVIPGFPHALAFAFRTDNSGPQQVDEVLQVRCSSKLFRLIQLRILHNFKKNFHKQKYSLLHMIVLLENFQTLDLLYKL
jgi:hypothetical protein